MDVARATSSPIRSSMRRSTPEIGEGVQSSRAACTAARKAKSALRFMPLFLLSALSYGQRDSDPIQIFGCGRHLAVLHRLDRGDQLDMRRDIAADFLSFRGDHAVDEVDFGAPALEHILTHRWPGKLAAGIGVQPGEDL